MKLRLGLLLVASASLIATATMAAELPPAPPAPPAPSVPVPPPPKVTPDEIASAADAWRAIQELGTAQASLFLTVRQVRATGLPSVLVHRWRRVFTQATGATPLPPEDIARVQLVRHALRTLATFTGRARTDVTRALARFSDKPELFGVFTVIGEGLDGALTQIRAIAEGREKIDAGVIRSRLLARKEAFGKELDRFRKWAERYDLNAVRTAFYEALLFINEESEPRAMP